MSTACAAAWPPNAPCANASSRFAQPTAPSHTASSPQKLCKTLRNKPPPLPVRIVTKSPQVAALLLLTLPVRILCTKDNLRVSSPSRPLTYGCHSKCCLFRGFFCVSFGGGKILPAPFLPSSRRGVHFHAFTRAPASGTSGALTSAEHPVEDSTGVAAFWAAQLADYIREDLALHLALCVLSFALGIERRSMY